MNEHLKKATDSIRIVLNSRKHLDDDVVGAYLQDALNNIIWALELDAKEKAG